MFLFVLFAQAATSAAWPKSNLIRINTGRAKASYSQPAKRLGFAGGTA
jgi:hypothetical protein